MQMSDAVAIGASKLFRFQRDMKLSYVFRRANFNIFDHLFVDIE